MNKILYTNQEENLFNHSNLQADLANNPEVTHFKCEKISEQPEGWAIDTYNENGDFYDTYLYDYENQWQDDIDVLLSE